MYDDDDGSCACGVFDAIITLLAFEFLLVHGTLMVYRYIVMGG